MTTHPCHCDNGKIHIEVSTMAIEGWSKSTSTINCLDCKGVGRMTDAQFKKREAMQKHLREDWCHCEDTSGRTTHHNDGQGDYYTHDRCGKICQVG